MFVTSGAGSVALRRVWSLGTDYRRGINMANQSYETLYPRRHLRFLDAHHLGEQSGVESSI